MIYNDPQLLHLFVLLSQSSLTIYYLLKKHLVVMSGNNNYTIYTIWQMQSKHRSRPEAGIVNNLLFLIAIRNKSFIPTL